MKVTIETIESSTKTKKTIRDGSFFNCFTVIDGWIFKKRMYSNEIFLTQGSAKTKVIGTAETKREYTKVLHTFLNK